MSVVAGVIAVLLGVPAAAYGMWTVTGSGLGRPRAAKFSSTMSGSASTSGSSVTLTWSAAPLNDATVTYNVLRSGVTAGGDCANPTSGAGDTTVTCTDTNVPDGSYTYYVHAMYGPWSGPAVYIAVTVNTLVLFYDNNAKPTNGCYSLNTTQALAQAASVPAGQKMRAVAFKSGGGTVSGNLVVYQGQAPWVGTVVSSTPSTLSGSGMVTLPFPEITSAGGWYTFAFIPTSGGGGLCFLTPSPAGVPGADFTYGGTTAWSSTSGALEMQLFD